VRPGDLPIGFNGVVSVDDEAIVHVGDGTVWVSDIPLMVISPWAKKNFVDHTLTDQSSMLRFIEDNRLNGVHIQPGASFDTIAGTIENMFDFIGNRKDKGILILNPATGAP
jgi:phospholipase C